MSEVLHTATLIRGGVHVIANLKGGDDFVFERGVAVVVDDRLRDALEREGVDQVVGGRDEETGEIEVFEKEKFSFEDYSGNLPVGSVVPVGLPASRDRRRVARKEIVS